MKKSQKILSAFLSTAMLLGMAMPATVSAAQTGEKGMKIVNGSAQPIVLYSDAHAEGYSNDNSDIHRFSV